MFLMVWHSERPQLIKLQGEGNSKTIEWFLAPDETVANVDQSRVMIGYRKPIDVLEYSGKVDLPPGQDETIDICNSELRDISVKGKKSMPQVQGSRILIKKGPLCLQRLMESNERARNDVRSNPACNASDYVHEIMSSVVDSTHCRKHDQ